MKINFCIFLVEIKKRILKAPKSMWSAIKDLITLALPHLPNDQVWHFCTAWGVVFQSLSQLTNSNSVLDQERAWQSQDKLAWDYEDKWGSGAHKQVVYLYKLKREPTTDSTAALPLPKADILEKTKSESSWLYTAK